MAGHGRTSEKKFRLKKNFSLTGRIITHFYQNVKSLYEILPDKYR